MSTGGAAKVNKIHQLLPVITERSCWDHNGAYRRVNNPSPICLDPPEPSPSSAIIFVWRLSPLQAEEETGRRRCPDVTFPPLSFISICHALLSSLMEGGLQRSVRRRDGQRNWYLHFYRNETFRCGRRRINGLWWRRGEEGVEKLHVTLMTLRFMSDRKPPCNQRCHRPSMSRGSKSSRRG